MQYLLIGERTESPKSYYSIPYNDCAVTYTRYGVMKILQLTHVLRVTLVCSPIKMHREGSTGTRRGGDTFPIISLLQCVVNLGGSACMHGEMKHPSLRLVLEQCAKNYIYLAFVHAYTSLLLNLEQKQSDVERSHLLLVRRHQFAVCVDR